MFILHTLRVTTLPGATEKRIKECGTTWQRNIYESFFHRFHFFRWTTFVGIVCKLFSFQEDIFYVLTRSALGYDIYYFMKKHFLLGVIWAAKMVEIPSSTLCNYNINNAASYSRSKYLIVYYPQWRIRPFLMRDSCKLLFT